MVLLLSGPVLGEKKTYFPNRVKAVSGNDICCSSHFLRCTQACAKNTGDVCRLKCEKSHCLADESRCAPPQLRSPAATPSQADKSSDLAKAGSDILAEDGVPTAELRHDGKLTGPGTVHFQAYNDSTGSQDLKIIGIIFGKNREGALEILKSTPTQAVIPSHPSAFTLVVNDKEFSDWEKRYSALTIAFTFESEQARNRWEYVNLLKPEDVARGRPGEFLVKGSFVPRAQSH